ncbi:TlpA family protein disulfide reductase [Sphingobacterium tabacisoli]|uniref:TlpA family protein disulfide reductase n=1 Tax=Sphingobacterium tabacisoli TaxID=2044855 RepID=A0ABW5L6H4_9SPHI|nr:thioredoxin domain-containing protein [Sphingobacterium tabacisoli]
MTNKIMLLIVSICTLFLNTTFGQNNGKLGVGDIAPEIRFSKWLKGPQFNTFDPQQIYVMEFWATWCGPCKQAMPHLTELQKQYEGKATFVGVNVWEKISKGESYETVVPNVEKFVRGNDTNMGYTVFVDNGEQHMGNNWLKAAGQNGIPASFIIKDNRIVWLGHPNGLDAILPKVLDGSFDEKAFKAEADKNAQKEREYMEARMALFNPIQEALLAKDHKKAFALMDKLTSEKPEYKKMMDITKFKTLLTEIDERQAVDFAKEALVADPSISSLLLAEIYKVDGLSNETYIWLADNFPDKDKITNPLVADAIATCYAKGGNFEKAIISQKKALEIAEKALKEGTMVGTVMDYTVQEYKDKIALYKKGELK